MFNEKKSATNDNWNFWLCFFVFQKWPFRDRQLVLLFWFTEILILMVFGGARSLGQVVKSGVLNKQKLDTENLD